MTTTRNALPPPFPTVPRCDQAAFQTTLQDAIDAGTVLEVASDVYLSQPVVVHIRDSHQGWFGMDGRHHKIYSTVKGAPALTVMMDDTTPPGTCARSMLFQNFSVICDGNDNGALVFDVPFNDRWIVNPTWRDIWVEGSGGKYGIEISGSIFEGNLYSVGTMNCKQNGMRFANAGPDGNKGVVSALRYWGGTHRQNALNGIVVDQYDGPRDVRLFGLYFCENGGAGFSSIAGAELIDGCGFENNNYQGIYLENYGRIRNCTGSTYGPQNYLINSYVVGKLLIDSCGVEGYGGGEPKVAALSGNGLVLLENVGVDSVDIDGAVQVVAK